MSRINLLPPEVLKLRSAALLARRITVVGMALGALLVGLYGIRTWQVLSLRGELEDARAEAAAVQGEIDAYADLVAQQQAVVSAKDVVSSLLAGEVSWSEQLLHVASTVPSGFALSSLTGTVTQGAGGPVIGSIVWAGTSSGYLPTEAWLVRLDAQEGWANGWLQSAQGGEGGLTVNGSVDLTIEAITPRGGGPA